MASITPPHEPGGPRTESGPGPCPSVDDINRLATGSWVSEAVSRHVEACAACRSRLAEARDEAAFLTRFRTLSVPAPEGSPRLPGYRTREVISAGAQGVVYRAVQESTQRDVAIKTLAAGPAASPRQRARAEREAEIAARLRHPNIVTVFESRRLGDGRIAVVMEYVDGAPIDQWTPPGPTAAERQRALLRVFIAVCGAIHHAHLGGVIHRDIKPDNILVTPEGRPVVLDFGIAKAGGLHTTMTGEFAGTPAYASPEQVAGKPDDVNALTDVYSLGVVLYRLLCGKMPYSVEGSLLDVARSIESALPALPRSVHPAISPDLEAIVLRALNKEKPLRYQSAASLARDIERFLGGEPVEARAGSGWYLLRKALLVNRRRLLWAGAAAALLLGAGVSVLLSLSSATASARLASARAEQVRKENLRARAVTELLREVIPSSDPARPEITVAVDAGLGRLFTRLESGAFADDPDLDQMLRRLWGGVYTGSGAGRTVGRVAYAEVSLRKGLVGLRLKHGSDNTEVAATLHELAGVMLVRKRASEAESFCRESLDIRRRLLGPNSVPVGESRALLARILNALGDHDRAITEADAAIRIFAPLPPGEGDLAIASMSALKGRIALDARDAAKAEPLIRDALVRRLRRLSVEDPDLLFSLSELADLSELNPDSPLIASFGNAWTTGGPTFAESLRRDLAIIATPDRDYDTVGFRTGRTEALGRMLPVLDAILPADDPAIITLLLGQVRSAQAERFSDARAAAALHAAELLASRRGPMDPAALFCMEEGAHALAFAGRAKESVDLVRRSCQFWDSVDPRARDPVLAALARRYLGWYLALDKQYEASAVEHRRAIEALRYTLGPGHHVVALAESGMALCLLETGDLDGADSLSESALRVSLESPATPIDQTCHARFIRGRVLIARGRPAEAIEAMLPVWELFYKWTMPAFAWRVMYLDDLERAYLALGDEHSATRWRAEQGRDYNAEAAAKRPLPGKADETTRP